MSSVLIKGMKMPKNCEQCRFGYEEDAAWMVCIPQQASVMKESVNGIRHPDCPLVEVPAPHGRLIDADKLMRDISKYHVSDGKFQHWVDVQQTVIEAEGTEWLGYMDIAMIIWW